MINIARRATLNNLIENVNETMQRLDAVGYAELLSEIDNLHEHAHRYNPNQTEGWIDTIHGMSDEARSVEARAYANKAASAELQAHVAPDNASTPADCLEGYVYGVLAWACERGIIEANDPKAQFMKSASELGELADAILEGDKDGIKDGIGDAAVTLIIQAALHNTTLLDCLRLAYNEIKGRTGKMQNGSFVKDKG